MDINRINRMSADFERVIESGIKCSKFVGACLGVYIEGKPVYESAMGMSDREKNIPMTKDTLFRMFSMTKPVTSLAAMQLWERGVIDLTHPLQWYFPEFKNSKALENGKLVSADRDILIKDLLNMTSGIPYPDIWNESQKQASVVYDEINRRLSTDSPMSTAEFCRKMGSVPLMFQPGAEWAYGASADILGGVIERASDMPLDEYYRKYIFEPLNMSDTDFWVSPEKRDRFAQLYTWDGENGCLKTEPDPHLGMNDYLTKPAFISGGAGLISTLSDYAAFANTLANGGENPELGVRLIGKNTWKYMRTPQLNASQQKTVLWDSLVGHSYGNLLRVLVNPNDYTTNAPVGEFGWDGWTGTYMTICPEEKLSMVYLIQNCGAGVNDVVRSLRNIVYGVLD